MGGTLSIGPGDDGDRIIRIEFADHDAAARVYDWIEATAEPSPSPVVKVTDTQIEMACREVFDLWSEATESSKKLWRQKMRAALVAALRVR